MSVSFWYLKKMSDNHAGIILAAARSKSYKYAASDLKLASDFAQHISDWKGYPTHADFLNQLRSQHPRKMSFWSLINPDTYD